MPSPPWEVNATLHLSSHHPTGPRPCRPLFFSWLLPAFEAHCHRGSLHSSSQGRGRTSDTHGLALPFHLPIIPASAETPLPPMGPPGPPKPPPACCPWLSPSASPLLRHRPHRVATDIACSRSLLSMRPRALPVSSSALRTVVRAVASTRKVFVVTIFCPAIWMSRQVW